MNLNLLNQSKVAMPRQFLQCWQSLLVSELQRRRVKQLKRLNQILTIVFLDTVKARALNRQYRGKDYATDVLSFEGEAAADELGELVLCPQVLKKQARVHGLSQREELGYLVLHGILHLLGYEHEFGGADEREMYALQDEVFDRLREKLNLERRGKKYVHRRRNIRTKAKNRRP